MSQPENCYSDLRKIRGCKTRANEASACPVDPWCYIENKTNFQNLPEAPPQPPHSWDNQSPRGRNPACVAKRADWGESASAHTSGGLKKLSTHFACLLLGWGNVVVG